MGDLVPSNQHAHNSMIEIKSTKLLILGAGEMQVPIIKKAKDMGAYTIVADFDPLALGFSYADQKLHLSTNDIPALISESKSLQIDGVLTTSDYPVRSVAAICNNLKLAGPTTKAADLCTNKYLLREHLLNNEFLVPKFINIKGPEDLKKIDFFPCIIKPVDSSGSRGVKKVLSKEGLWDAYQDALKYTHTSSIIAEEFLNGSEYSVEALTQNSYTSVIAITEKHVTGDEGMYFVENRHLIPSNLTDSIRNEIAKLILSLIESIDLRDSASHTELMVTEKGIYIIEIGARLGGDYITSHLVPLANGTDMLESVINISLKIPVNIKKNNNYHAGIQFITPDNYYKASDFITQHREIVIESSLKPFRNVKVLSSFDRLGYFIARAETREKLIDILNCDYNGN